MCALKVFYRKFFKTNVHFYIFFSLRQFQDSGVMSKLKSRFISRNNPSVTNYNAVNLNDIAPTLTVVTGGIILALCVLIIEKTYYTLTTRFKNSKFFVAKSNSQFQKVNNKKNLNNIRLIGYLP